MDGFVHKKRFYHDDRETDTFLAYEAVIIN